jgi:hypothetical protein
MIRGIVDGIHYSYPIMQKYMLIIDNCEMAAGARYVSYIKVP